MIHEECSNCKFFLIDEGAEQGICRRFPAVPLSFGMQPTGLEIGTRPQMVPGVITYFPAMRPDGWCGEYKVRETIQ